MIIYLVPSEDVFITTEVFLSISRVSSVGFE